MKDLKISELIAMQNTLQNRMSGKWLPIIPENGHFSLLWMFEEMGELVAIVKKRGDNGIMEDDTVRVAFVEELSDTLMYFIDLMTFLVYRQKNCPRRLYQNTRKICAVTL